MSAACSAGRNGRRCWPRRSRGRRGRAIPIQERAITSTGGGRWSASSPTRACARPPICSACAPPGGAPPSARRTACRSRSVPRISSPSLPPRGAGSSLGARRSPWREESMSERAVVREVGLRDGLQSLAETMPTEQKIAWLEAEYRAGVRDIEVSSFVPPKLLPQLADAEAVVRHALSLPGLTVSALIPNLKGAERGLALGVHEMNFVLSVSESHNRANVRRSTAESIADFRRVVALVRAAPPGRRPRLACGLATAFGCTIEGDVDEDRVCQIAAEVAEAGTDAITLADTVGYGNPAAVERVFRRVIAEVAPLPVSGHFHDTRGLGLANVLAALNAGARAFDASLGGLGGCPYAPGATGNIVTEDLAFMLAAMGFETGIDLGRLLQAREILARALPAVALHGAIAKAGLPKNFHPMRASAQAAE